MSLIKNNLYKLLENKNMSVNKLSEKTGISRRTLTNLINGDAKGIQFETIETLLNFFEIDLNEFWYYEKEEFLLESIFSESNNISTTFVTNDNTDINIKTLLIESNLIQNKKIKKSYATIINIQGYSKEYYDNNYEKREKFYLTGANLFATSLRNESQDYYLSIFEYLNNDKIEVFTKNIYYKVFNHLYNNNIDFSTTDVFTVGYPTFTVPVLIKMDTDKTKGEFFFESWRSIKKGNFYLSANKLIELQFKTIHHVNEIDD